MNGSLLVEKWNQRHREAEEVGEPAAVLQLNAHLLPVSGRALDLACGRGANALFLARAGLETHAWDFSPVAIQRLQACAAKEGLSIDARVRDVEEAPPEAATFDLILVSHYLQRSLAPHLMAALRPGGRLFYQTFVQEVQLERGPTTPDWRLAPNELLRLFAPLRVHFYREDGLIGRERGALSDQALLVASKPEQEAIA